MAYTENKLNTTRSTVSVVFIGLLILILTINLSGCDQSSRSINRVKIAVDEEGIYRLNTETLLSVGMDIRKINPAQLRLSVRGAPQSLFVYKTNDSLWLEFYGTKSDSIYSPQNIYLLENIEGEGDYTHLVDPGSLAALSSEPSGTTTLIDTIRHEENLLYFPQVEALDHWYWVSVSSGQVYEFPLVLSDPVLGDGSIRLGLWSNTEAAQNPDHHLLIAINGQNILDASWEGKGEHQLEAVIPSGILLPGENKVRVEVPADIQTTVDICWINWFEISYPRLAVAHDEQLKFVADGSLYSLSGFKSAVHIYVVDKDDVVALGHIENNPRDHLVFQSTTGKTYYAVGEDGYLSPVMITPLVGTPDLRALCNGADDLVVGPESLLASAGNLLSHREAQGFRVMGVNLSAIYDQYNYGFPEPEAVRSFLIDAASSWGTAPRYVLLVGDASYDPKNYLNLPESNFLPAFFVQTQFGGQTASDLPFSDLDGDGIPDIAVGRVPASTDIEVAAFVRKTIAYENQNSQAETSSHLLAIADGQEASFRNDAQRFLDIFTGYGVSELYTPEAGITDANLTIQKYFNEGYAFISYFGHGSVTMWGKDRLFTVDNAASLSNAQYPIVINMTCLTGLFTHPKIDSLAEVLLLNPGGGAAAILAPTSLTLPGDQSLFSTPFGLALRSGAYEHLGDIFLVAQQGMSISSPADRDVLETFLLFGDPGLLIRSH